MTPRIGTPRWRALAAAGLATLAWGTRAQAQPACEIQVLSPGALKWEAAARDAEQRILHSASPPQDCQSITVTVLPDGTGRLAFTTSEGRHADRQLQTPDELAPAVEALLVTVAAQPEPATPVSAAAPLPAPHAPPAPPPSAARGESSAPRPSPHFVIEGAAGGRFAFGHKYLTPAVLLRASGVFERWELGIFGESDPIFKRLSGASPAGFSMSALVVGALLGRRERAGRFELNYGVDFGIASVASSADAAPGSSVDASQQRAGVYLGGRYPRDKSVRLTLDLLSDVALSGLRKAATDAAGLPPFPRYGVALALGVETVAL